MLPLEAVPNFSEGRDRPTIDAIGEALVGARPPARRPLGRGSQPLGLHARRRRGASSSMRSWPASRAHASGSTCAGTRARTRASARPTSSRSCRSCQEDMPSARAAAARGSARRVGDELALPVFLYGELGAGRGPAFFRRGGPASCSGGSTPASSFPTSARRSSTSGGRRDRRRAPPLIAFNVNLAGGDRRRRARDRARPSASVTAASRECARSGSDCRGPGTPR